MHDIISDIMDAVVLGLQISALLSLVIFSIGMAFYWTITLMEWLG